MDAHGGSSAPIGEIVLLLRKYPNTEVGLKQMVCSIIALDRITTQVVIEAAEGYHEPTTTVLQNSLVFLTDKTIPEVNKLFSNPEYADGHPKWVAPGHR